MVLACEKHSSVHAPAKASASRPVTLSVTADSRRQAWPTNCLASTVSVWCGFTRSSSTAGTASRKAESTRKSHTARMRTASSSRSSSVSSTPRRFTKCRSSLPMSCASASRWRWLSSSDAAPPPPPLPLPLPLPLRVPAAATILASSSSTSNSSNETSAWRRRRTALLHRGSEHFAIKASSRFSTALDAIGAANRVRMESQGITTRHTARSLPGLLTSAVLQQSSF